MPEQSLDFLRAGPSKTHHCIFASNLLHMPCEKYSFHCDVRQNMLSCPNRYGSSPHEEMLLAVDVALVPNIWGPKVPGFCYRLIAGKE
jgi:hypothetical protein